MEQLAPAKLNVRLATLSAQCLVCAAACSTCIDAALASGLLDTFRRFVNAASDCQQICQVTANVADRYDGRTQVLAELARACARASAEAAAACDAHVDAVYAACAATCRECERACAQMASALRWR